MKQLIVYETTDGKRFGTLEAADKHVQDTTLSVLRDLLRDAAIKNDCKGFIGNADAAFAEHLFENLPLLRRLVHFYDANAVLEEDE